MPLVGEDKHLLVATAVAEGFYLIERAVGKSSVSGICCSGCRKSFRDSAYFLCSIAVVALEASRQLAVFYFYLCTKHLHAFQIADIKEGAYPVVDAGTYDEDLSSSYQCFMYQGCLLYTSGSGIE